MNLSSDLLYFSSHLGFHNFIAPRSSLIRPTLCPSVDPRSSLDLFPVVQSMIALMYIDFRRIFLAQPPGKSIFSNSWKIEYILAVAFSCGTKFLQKICDLASTNMED